MLKVFRRALTAIGLMDRKGLTQTTDRDRGTESSQRQIRTRRIKVGDDARWVIRLDDFGTESPIVSIALDRKVVWTGTVAAFKILIRDKIVGGQHE